MSRPPRPEITPRPKRPTTRRGEAAGADLFAGLPSSDWTAEALAESATILRRFAEPVAARLVQTIADLTAVSPFRNMVTPGGYTMSVAMTNCGRLGWVTDRRGYRYDTLDPMSGEPWPPLPPLFRDLATRAAAAAGFAGFEPDACLVNRYEPGTRLSMHQDRNERDFSAPIVSVSLGLPAVFMFGGARRQDRPRRVRLESGDVVVWGGATRLNFHGVAPLPDGEHPLTGRHRINLTFRKAG